jgi:hypothetical protein
VKNTFAFTPDDKPPRVIRFINAPASKFVSVLDDQKNILFVNRPLFDTLDDLQRNRVERTHAASITLHDHQLVEGEYEYDHIPSMAAE